MLPKRAYIIAGTTFLGIGIIIILNSFQSITGFVIFEDADANYGYFVGLWLIIVGILILTEGRETSDLENMSASGIRIEQTRRFTKDIIKHDLSKINEAIRKIGTGAGHEHRLKGGGYSISTSKGGRIVFDYDSSRTRATLESYDEGHNYNKMLRHRR